MTGDKAQEKLAERSAHAAPEGQAVKESRDRSPLLEQQRASKEHEENPDRPPRKGITGTYGKPDMSGVHKMGKRETLQSVVESRLGEGASPAAVTAYMNETARLSGFKDYSEIKAGDTVQFPAPEQKADFKNTLAQNDSTPNAVPHPEAIAHPSGGPQPLPLEKLPATPVNPLPAPIEAHHSTPAEAPQPIPIGTRQGSELPQPQPVPIEVQHAGAALQIPLPHRAESRQPGAMELASPQVKSSESTTGEKNLSKTPEQRLKDSLDPLAPPGKHFDIKFEHTSKGTSFLVSGSDTNSNIAMQQQIQAQGSEFWKNVDSMVSSALGHTAVLKVGGTHAGVAEAENIPTAQATHKPPDFEQPRANVPEVQSQPGGQANTNQLDSQQGRANAREAQDDLVKKEIAGAIPPGSSIEVTTKNNQPWLEFKGAWTQQQRIDFTHAMSAHPNSEQALREISQHRPGAIITADGVNDGHTYAQKGKPLVGGVDEKANVADVNAPQGQSNRIEGGVQDGATNTAGQRLEGGLQDHGGANNHRLDAGISGQQLETPPTFHGSLSTTVTGQSNPLDIQFTNIDASRPGARYEGHTPGFTGPTTEVSGTVHVINGKPVLVIDQYKQFGKIYSAGQNKFFWQIPLEQDNNGQALQYAPYK